MAVTVIKFLAALGACIPIASCAPGATTMVNTTNYIPSATTFVSTEVPKPSATLKLPLHGTWARTGSESASKTPLPKMIAPIQVPHIPDWIAPNGAGSLTAGEQNYLASLLGVSCKFYR